MTSAPTSVSNPSRFTDLGLADPLLRALKDEGYTEPSPVQTAAIPYLLDGRDIIATAKTGTGKTAAFCLPMLQLLHEAGPSDGVLRGLVLTPTRELALQIHASLRAYGRHLKLTHAVVVGGVGIGPQIAALRRRPDILVATPGRLLDLMNQGKVRLRDVEIAVLDEADRMLDMGFIRDVRKIVDTLPKRRQTLLFSATMSSQIAELAAEMLYQPARVEVTPPATVADNIEQKVLFVEQGDKKDLLVHLLKDGTSIRSALVFTRTRHRASRVARQLVQAGIGADSIHSDKSQGARQKALAAFDAGRVRVLVATDIVARGIDVDGISHVINFEVPNEAENYVHRIGRTARAGAAGIALSFCNLEELEHLAGIEKLIGVRLVEIAEHPFRSAAIAGRRDATIPASSSGRASQGDTTTSRSQGPARSRNRRRDRGEGEGRSEDSGRSQRQGNGRAAGRDRGNGNSSNGSGGVSSRSEGGRVRGQDSSSGRAAGQSAPARPGHRGASRGDTAPPLHFGRRPRPS